ncbi:MAG: hypothetical protein HOP20_10680 [Sulfuriferula sp.]|nr:hypothetical protein [Sulfuriferula sp.]
MNQEQQDAIPRAMIGIFAISLIAAATAQSTEADTNPFVSQPASTSAEGGERAKIQQLKIKKQVDGGCGAGSCAAKMSTPRTPTKNINMKTQGAKP